MHFLILLSIFASSIRFTQTYLTLLEKHMSSLEKVNNTIATAEDVARKIWLAGLGAYGKSFEEIQSQYERLNSETSRFFEELVFKGEKLEAGTKEKLKEKTAIEKRVDDVRKKLGLDSSDTDTKIDELSQKVDALVESVSKLA
jgi:poly(hydroxyalkanoate) granule-associated protein